MCRHTVLSALAQFRAIAIHNASEGAITPEAPAALPASESAGNGGEDDGLAIPAGDAPLPATAGQPWPPKIAPIRLSVAEAARTARLASDWEAGLITRARLAFRLRWSRWAARPPGPHPLAPLQQAPPAHRHLNPASRKEVTQCNHKPANHTSR